MRYRQPHHSDEEQLQISEFIKDPSTLKLLILAGTNIKPTQLPTVGKCHNLIKLDLSSNMLSSIPISFSNFIQLKILYLHDNNIVQITIQNITVEYITLFNNSLKNYRQKIISSNQNLMALDYHIITKRQRLRQLEPSHSTELKWPIVESSSALENQQDYLNLLKAEIFVITNLYKRITHIQSLQKAISGFSIFLKYKKILLNLTDEIKIRKSSVIDAVAQWKNYVAKKKRLREFLKMRGKEQLLLNTFHYNKFKRSPKINQAIENFVVYITRRLHARKILRPHLNSFLQFIPISKKLTYIYQNTSGNEQAKRLYFLKSQWHFLDKIFLYAKRLLFNKKQYDLCDNFEKIVFKQKRQFYVFRIKDKNIQEKSFLKESIRRTISLIVGQKNLERRHFNYTRKGHKKIGLKNRQQFKLPTEKRKQFNEKISRVYNKINKKYQSYDTLVTYEINDKRLFQLLMKIIRYFNSGNSHIILSNQTAYFQTEVLFENQEQLKKNEKIFVGLDFFIKRNIAANVIQKFWRRIKEKKQSTKRAKNMISHWLRELPFRQKINMNKLYSYKKTIQKNTDVYIQLDIYMKLPHPTNPLQILKYESIAKNYNEILYQTLHKETYVEIVEISRRKWIRILFSSIEKVLEAHHLFLFTTFKFYYNGFFIELFNHFETQEEAKLEIYQRKVMHIFGIQVKKSILQHNSLTVSKKLPIQNTDPFFVWAQVGQKGVESKYEMQRKSLPISIFVYNKHQKPLKVNCDVNWLNPSTIYYYKKQVLKSTSLHGTMIRSRTPTKKLSSSNSRKKAESFIIDNDFQRNYLTKIKSNQKRDRRNSEISPHNTVLLRNHRFKSRAGMSENIQVDLLSHTISIKKR